MADVTDLLVAQLLRDQGQEEQKSPFYSAGLGMDSVLATMPKYNLKPWEAALAGALGGFGSGLLKGMGTASADQKSAAISTKLAEALSATGEDRYNLLAADPELGKYSGAFKIQDLRDQQETEATKQKLMDAEAIKPKDLQTVYGADGTKHQSWIDAQGVEHQIGGGVPAYDPNTSTGLSPVSKPLIDSMVNAGLLDPEIGANITTNAELSQVQRASELAGIKDRFGNANLSQKAEDSVAGATALEQKLKPLYDRLRAYVGDTTNPQAQYAKISIEQLVPASEMQSLKQWLEFSGMDIAIEMNGGGRAVSDQDRATITDFIGGKTALATGDIFARLDHLLNVTNTQALERLRIESKQKKTASSAKEVAKDFFTQLSPDRQAQYAPHFESIFGETATPERDAGPPKTAPGATPTAPTGGGLTPERKKQIRDEAYRKRGLAPPP